LLLRRAKRKEVKNALENRSLQEALRRASLQHSQKFEQTKNEIAWEELKARARAIREECAKELPELIRAFQEEARKAGAQVHLASNSEQALAAIEDILKAKEARLIVKSKSMVSEEIGLNEYLEKRGYRVIETDLGEWIVQLAGERPSHITAPALHKTKEEVAALLSRHLGRPIPADIKEMVKTARRELRSFFSEADAGISGANLAIAESGTLVIVSNEGNARLVTGLPPVHIALITTEKFVRTLEQATTLIKALVTASSGAKLTSYVSFITGPSRTTDIEKELVIGAHGPEEVHIIILDNGRLSLAKEGKYEEILYCLKCGGCMLQCPVFQAVGGHVYGGPVYPGGIGVLLSTATRPSEDFSKLVDLCADCKKCEEFCPVGIPSGELLLGLKNLSGSRPWEKVLSGIFKKRSLAELGARILAVLQRPWQANGYWRSLPFSRAKGKRFPALKFRKGSGLGEKKGKRILLFEGCLVKFFFPEVRESVSRALSHFGYEVVVPKDQVCCGAPSFHLGRKKDVFSLARANLRSFARADPDFIITVCPTGNSFLKKTYSELLPEASRWQGKIFDFTEFMVNKGLSLEIEASPKDSVFYHYPCHLVNDLKLKDEPPKLLKALGYKPEMESEPYTCCGFCGVFSIRNPELSEHFWKNKREKLLASQSPLVATDCPGCLFQLRAHLKAEESEKRVYHTAELIAQALEDK
jgi:iron-sulfur cluster protein